MRWRLDRCVTVEVKEQNPNLHQRQTMTPTLREHSSLLLLSLSLHRMTTREIDSRSKLMDHAISLHLVLSY